MIPNIIAANKQKDMFVNSYSNRFVINFENIFRISTFILMIINIPYTYKGLYFDYGLLTYILINSILLVIYLVTWIVLWKNNNLIRALILSVTPTCIFVISCLIILNIPLIVSGVMFGIFHILLSVKNTLK